MRRRRRRKLGFGLFSFGGELTRYKDQFRLNDPTQIGDHNARGLHPTPYALHPLPYTLHPTPCTLHPTPCNLHPNPNPDPSAGQVAGDAGGVGGLVGSFIQTRARENRIAAKKVPSSSSSSFTLGPRAD